MTRGIGGWAALLCGFLTLTAEARAQVSPRARLGLPSAVDTFPDDEQTSLPGKGPIREEIQPAAFQIPGAPADLEDVRAPLIQRDPPGPERLFRLESEEELFARVATERRLLKLHMDLPVATAKVPLPYRDARAWPNMIMQIEPNYVCYGRLRFEQRNAERYGWDLGILHPPLSAAIFFGDVLTLPLSWAVDPLRCYDCNTGLCLPGDATPLMWYRLRSR